MKRKLDDEESGPSEADTARKGLVSLNALDYVMQPDLSVAVSRTHKRHFSQQKVYTPGQRSISIWNSGADYIGIANSFFEFTLINTATTAFHFGVGSSLNLIKQIILTTRSGDELERIDEVGHLNGLLDRYMFSSDWINTHGKLMGYGSRVQDDNTPFVLPISKGWTFIIPLSHLTGLFRSFDRLLPSMLCSGLRIEIEWQTAVKAVSSITGDQIAVFTINDPTFVLDSYQLTDSIQRVMNEEASMRGLELVYSSFYYHLTNPSSTSINAEVRKAVSRALGVLTKISPTTKPAGAYTGDLFSSKPFNVTRYQLRLGSLYFPHQAITSQGMAYVVANSVPGTTANIDAMAEIYHHTMASFGKMGTPSAPSNVPLLHLSDVGAVRTSAPDISYFTKLSCIYTDLERSNVQKLTGVPVNNSRVAEVQMTVASLLWPDTAGGQWDINDATEFDPTVSIHIWLHYVRLARVFLQNVEIEE